METFANTIVLASTELVPANTKEYPAYSGFMSFDAVTILATLLNTLIIFIVFRVFLFDKVNAILDKRNGDVEKTYEEADVALKNAKSMEAEYETKISEAKEAAAMIKNDAKKKADKTAEGIVSDAKTEAQTIREKATADVESEKKKAVNQIKDEISGIAISIAEKVVSKEIDSSAHSKLIDDFINEIGEAS